MNKHTINNKPPEKTILEISAHTPGEANSHISPFINTRNIPTTEDITTKTMSDTTSENIAIKDIIPIPPK